MFHGQIPGICVSWNQQTVIPTHLWLQKLINHISLRATLIVNSLLLLVLLLLLLLLLLPLAESHGWRNRGTGRLSPACRRAQRGPAGLRAERRRPQMPWATGPKCAEMVTRGSLVPEHVTDKHLAIYCRSVCWVVSTSNYIDACSMIFAFFGQLSSGWSLSFDQFPNFGIVLGDLLSLGWISGIFSWDDPRPCVFLCLH